MRLARLSGASIWWRSVTLDNAFERCRAAIESEQMLANGRDWTPCTAVDFVHGSLNSPARFDHVASFIENANLDWIIGRDEKKRKSAMHVALQVNLRPSDVLRCCRAASGRARYES
jgi:hypothetical protein